MCTSILLFLSLYQSSEYWLAVDYISGEDYVITAAAAMSGRRICMLLNFRTQFPIPQIILLFLSLYPSSEYWLAANLFPSRIT